MFDIKSSGAKFAQNVIQGGIYPDGTTTCTSNNTLCWTYGRGITSIVEWSNITNALTDDENVATLEVPAAAPNRAHTLHFNDFGFDIPEDALITGIEVKANAYVSGGSTGDVIDYIVYLRTPAFGMVGTNKARGDNVTWSTDSSNIITWGGPTDMWDWGWTPDQINSSLFGFSLKPGGIDLSNYDRVAAINYVTINVYYFDPNIASLFYKNETKLPTQAVSDGTGTLVSWSNPQNILTTENVTASISSSSGQGGGNGNIFDNLVATDFEFNLPDDAIIYGIKVDISAYRSTSSTSTCANLQEIQLLRNGIGESQVKCDITAENQKAGAYLDGSTNLNSHSFGGPFDTWGLLWKPSDINAENFGVRFKVGTAPSNTTVTVQVRLVQITVYWTNRTLILYPSFFLNQFTGKAIDFTSDTLKVALVTEDFRFVASHSVWDDIEEYEVSGLGYDAGGSTVSNISLNDVLKGSPEAVSGIVAVHGEDVVWPTQGGGFTNARYAVLYKDSGEPSTSPLIGAIDLGSTKSNSSEFKLLWDTNGILQVK